MALARKKGLKPRVERMMRVMAYGRRGGGESQVETAVTRCLPEITLVANYYELPTNPCVQQQPFCMQVLFTHKQAAGCEQKRRRLIPGWI